MAITYAYPTTTPELRDLLIGTEIPSQGGEDTPRTRTFTMQSVIDLATATFNASSSNLYAPKLNPVFSGTVTGVTKAMVGLSNADNTTDLLKPISTATQTALNLKANIATPTFTGLATASGFKTPTGTNAQFLMADGTTSTGAAYVVPTLQQVATAGNTATKGITLTSTVVGVSGIKGISTVNNGIGVLGENNEVVAGAIGVKGSSLGGTGVFGYSSESDGVSGFTTSGSGVSGYGYRGVYGQGYTGVEADGSDIGLLAYGNSTGIRVHQDSLNSNGIYIRNVIGTGDAIVLDSSDEIVMKVNRIGEITAPKFIKTNGLSTQYLMANGDTSTGPTLQQVTTSGATTTNTITINKVVDQSALIITSSYSDPATSLLTLNANGGGTCIKAVGGGGATTVEIDSGGSGYAVYGRSDAGTAIYGYSITDTGVSGYASDGVGVTGSSTNGTGAYFYSSLGTGLAVSCTNALGTGAVIYGVGQGLNVTKGGISITGTVHTGTTYQLKLSLDSASKPSTSTWTVASDSRVKTNISPYTKGLETILAINPITYDYNGKAGFDPTAIGNIGIIAQDVLNVIPESINTFYAKLNEEDSEKTELYSFDSHALTFILINAIKQLNAEIELLKSK